MKFTLFSSALLWGVTAYSAIGFALAGSNSKTNAPATPSHMEADAVIYSAASANKLFENGMSGSASIASSPYQLLGVSFSDDPKQSFALFNVGVEMPRHFRVGTRLPNGMTVESIERRSVTLGGSDGTTTEVQLPVKK